MSRNVLPMLFGGLAVGTLLAGTSLAPGLAQAQAPAQRPNIVVMSSWATISAGKTWAPIIRA